jgi:exosortase/archaeosortase
MEVPAAVGHQASYLLANDIITEEARLVVLVTTSVSVFSYLPAMKRTAIFLT